MENWRKSRAVFWVFMIPPTAWLTLFFVAPLAIIWVMSFGEKRGLIDIDITGTVANYARAIEPLYLQILWKSIVIAVFNTVLCLLIGFPVAFAVSFSSAKWRPILLLLVILPFWTNLLIRTYALIAVLRIRGYVNFGLEWVWERADGLLAFAGLGQYQLLGTQYEPMTLLYNNFAVVFGLVYVYLPFMVLPLYATLERLDRSYIEASLDLGGGQVRTFRSVIVPLAMPGIISGVILVFIPSLGSFLIPDLLGGTDSQMIANVIERQFKSANDWPFGAALSFILMYATFGALALRAVLAKGRSPMDAG